MSERKMNTSVAAPGNGCCRTQSRRWPRAQQLTSRHMRRSVITAGMAALVLTSCTAHHSSASGSVEAKFLTAANSACQQTLKIYAQKVFPYSNFNPKDPVVAQLPQVGKYFDSVTFNHQELSFVKSFGTPSQGRTGWNDFVNLIGQQQAVVEEQIVDAKASNKPAFVATVTRVETLAKQIDAVGSAVGFGKGASCIQLFG
jgi:hypothetical protein